MLYALLGKDDTTAHASYEYVAITVLPNGRQSLGTQWNVGATSFTQARWEMSAWTADPVVAAVLAAVITGAPTPAMNAWNSEGIGLVTARYLAGTAIQSAFIFLVGGANGTGATQATELVIW